MEEMINKGNNPLGDIAKNVPAHHCGKVLGLFGFFGAVCYGLKLWLENMK